MTSADEDSQHRSPFTRPGFIAAGLVLAVIVVAGVVIGIANMTGDDPAADPAASTSSRPSTEPPASQSPSAPDAEVSVCGLEGSVTEATRLTTAPEAEWTYEGTVASPTSEEFGPGATDGSGFRYCFQRTPEGALFAASNALATGTNQAVALDWIDYFLAPGPYRDQLLAEGIGSESSTSARLRLAGFRLLSYDGDTARVDLAVRASADGSDITLSMIYNLVWSEGDWKLSAESAAPLDVATIPDVAGYVSFGG